MSAPETARDVIAEELCRLDEGWMVADYLPDADGVLDALTEAGFAVVKLPDPHPREDIGEVTTRWEDGLPHTVDVWDDNRDQVQLSYNFEPSEPLTPSESRYLGSALLAAAAYAEAGEGDE